MPQYWHGGVYWWPGLAGPISSSTDIAQTLLEVGFFSGQRNASKLHISYADLRFHLVMKHYPPEMKDKNEWSC